METSHWELVPAPLWQRPQLFGWPGAGSWQSRQLAALAVLWVDRCHSSMMASPVPGDLAVLWQLMQAVAACRAVTWVAGAPEPLPHPANTAGSVSRVSKINVRRW